MRPTPVAQVSRLRRRRFDAGFVYRRKHRGVQHHECVHCAPVECASR